VLRLSMKPTGWFHIGWSGEIPPGGVKPLRYFGQELVAFRAETGELSVLDAHCRHLGAHLGYDSHVRGDCVVCPYHGWQWDGTGRNRLVPYQENPTRALMRSWPVAECNGLIWMWHDPAGGPPRGGYDYPDVFAVFDSAPAAEADFYPCYPQSVIEKPNEPIHPQLVLENSADCAHFKFTHAADEYPRMQWFRAEGAVWHSQIGFISPKTKEPTLFLENHNTTIGVTAALFSGRNANYRLLLTATPIDDERSDLRVSYFFPRDGDTGDTLPPDLAAFARHTEVLFEEDARIWRHQAFVQKPIYALDDRAGYSAMRSWCEQFYEAPEGQRAVPVILEP
jgi:3-ketosteroid 9alpha-monooxygenase subunit A